MAISNALAPIHVTRFVGDVPQQLLRGRAPAAGSRWRPARPTASQQARVDDERPPGDPVQRRVPAAREDPDVISEPLDAAGVRGRRRHRRPGAAQPVDHAVVLRPRQPAAARRRWRRPDVVRVRGVGVRHGRAVDPRRGAAASSSCRTSSISSPEHRADIAAVNQPAAAAAGREARPARSDGDDLVAAMRDAPSPTSASHIAHGNTRRLRRAGAAVRGVRRAVRAGRPGDDHRGRAAAAAAGRRRRTARSPDVARRSSGGARRSSRTDERTRAFAVLAANVLAVAHEQQRLQADIAAAMDAGLLTADRIMDQVLPRWSPRPLDELVAARRRPAAARASCAGRSGTARRPSC